MDFGVSFTLIRTIAAIASALAGIAALMTDEAFTKRKQPPVGIWKSFPFAKFRITPWGATLLTIIVVSVGVQLAADLLKDSNDAVALQNTVEEIKKNIDTAVTDSTKRSGQAIAKASDDLVAKQVEITKLTSGVAKNAGSILTNLNRSMNPLSDIIISYTLRASIDVPEFALYRERLDKDAAVPHPSQTEIWTVNGDVVMYDGSPLLPRKEEEIPYYVLRCTGLGLMFYGKGNSNLGRPPADLSLDADTGCPAASQIYQSSILYNPKTHFLEITREVTPKSNPTMRETGRINSIPDLPGTQLLAMLIDSYFPSTSAAAQVSLIRDRLQLQRLIMKVNKRIIDLSQVVKTKRKVNGTVGYARDAMGWFTVLPDDLGKK